jgi:acetyl esterase/lipase
MRKLLLPALSLMTVLTVAAQEHPVIPLWKIDAPGAKGTQPEDTPTLTIYKAAQPSPARSGVVVLPGGGYVHLAFDYEGTEIAEWLNRIGLSAFVVKYRLGPKYQYPVQLWDAQQAIRYVRLHASEFSVAPDHIGVCGFSAGGHLAATTGTHFDEGDKNASDSVLQQSSRPDFMILAYPVITMQDPFAHQGSLHALLGEKPDPVLVRSLSNETQVTPRTPPCFLFHTTEDKVVPVQNSVAFYTALVNAGVPAEMHIYLRGRHGVGLALKDPVLSTWSERLNDWLAAQHFR